MKIENRVGDNTAPCGTPADIINLFVIVLFTRTANNLFKNNLLKTL